MPAQVRAGQMLVTADDADFMDEMLIDRDVPKGIEYLKAGGHTASST